jgi:hypothetical protein
MNKVELLNQLLISKLIEDLNDPNKCTPGLYQAARGIVNDNRDKLDEIPTDSLDSLESRLISKAPFKLK